MFFTYGFPVCVSNMMKATETTQRTLLGSLCCAFFSGLTGVSSENYCQSGLNFYTDLQELFFSVPWEDALKSVLVKIAEKCSDNDAVLLLLKQH